MDKTVENVCERIISYLESKNLDTYEMIGVLEATKQMCVDEVLIQEEELQEEETPTEPGEEGEEASEEGQEPNEKGPKTAKK